jgi:hypothetical protein
MLGRDLPTTGLDWPESGFIGKSMVITHLAIDFNIFIVSL